MDEDVEVDASSGTSVPPPLSPSDSVMSIGAFRPSLVWLFNHIRREDRDYLTKEDLKQLLGSKVDSTQLDEAFENLDLDKDREISLDEFIAGFAKFWKEAPHTPGSDPVESFNFPPEPQVEERYESGDCVPSDKLKESLSVLSSHNRLACQVGVVTAHLSPPPPPPPADTALNTCGRVSISQILSY